MSTERPACQIQTWDAPNEIQQRCGFDIDSQPQDILNTGVICSIGQSCENVDTLQRMIELGMTVARLNLGRHTYAYHAGLIKRVREAAQLQSAKCGYHREVAIAVDITAPTIRTGNVRGRDLYLEKGQHLVLTTRKDFRDNCTADHCWVDSEVAPVLQIVDVGARIYLDDGMLSCVCVDKTESDVICEVERGGFLGSRKRCLLPRGSMFKHVVMRKFRQDLLFAAEQQVDAIFCSYVESSDDVKRVKEILGSVGQSILIFAKIESRQAMRNIDYIVKEADGLFVARLDLVLEIPCEKLFIAQKSIIGKCNLARKPVICSAQMLDSMQFKPRPTRAEMSDVANAVLDGADCVMLTSETAVGDYPVESVAMCASICREAESAVYHEQVWNELRSSLANSYVALDAAQTAAIAAVEASHQSLPPVAAIIVVTTTGRSAFLISTFRPRCPILAITRQAQTAHICHFYRGVHPLFYDEPKKQDWAEDVDACINHGCAYGRSKKLLAEGSRVIIVTGSKAGAGFTDTMRLMVLPAADQPLHVLVKH